MRIESVSLRAEAAVVTLQMIYGMNMVRLCFLLMFAVPEVKAKTTMRYNVAKETFREI